MLFVATLIFLLITSIQNAFFDMIAVTGILYAAFYVLTAGHDRVLPAPGHLGLHERAGTRHPAAVVGGVLGG